MNPNHIRPNYPARVCPRSSGDRPGPRHRATTEQPTGRRFPRPRGADPSPATEQRTECRFPRPRGDKPGTLPEEPTRNRQPRTLGDKPYGCCLMPATYSPPRSQVEDPATGPRQPTPPSRPRSCLLPAPLDIVSGEAHYKAVLEAARVRKRSYHRGYRAGGSVRWDEWAQGVGPPLGPTPWAPPPLTGVCNG